MTPFRQSFKTYFSTHDCKIGYPRFSINAILKRYITELLLVNKEHYVKDKLITS